MPSLPGRKLLHYDIVGSLGAGAMGEVYRAKDTKLGREVAIKILPPHFAEDAERLRRFGREATMLASLNHPNVAQIFGVDEVDGLAAGAAESMLDFAGYGVLPDDRFAMVERAAWEDEPLVIHVVLNWDDELRAKTAGR